MAYTLTRADLIRKVAEGENTTQFAAEDVVEATFELMSTALSQGQSVKISKFGNLNLLNKKARPGRNPLTGDEVTVEERRVVTFHPGNLLRKRIAASVSKNSHVLSSAEAAKELLAEEA